jgi:hypothetical protein
MSVVAGINYRHHAAADLLAPFARIRPPISILSGARAPDAEKGLYCRSARLFSRGGSRWMPLNVKLIAEESTTYRAIMNEGRKKSLLCL